MMSRLFAVASSTFSKLLLPRTVYCEENASAPNNKLEIPTLVEQADESRSKKTKKIKTPIPFENLKNLIGQASVGTYDGFRCQVSKGLNMNAQVSHL